MPASALKRSTRRRSATRPARLPIVSRFDDEDGKSLWERWSAVLTTAFGVSTVLHLVMLFGLAFWMLATEADDDLQIDSGLDLTNETATVDRSELNLRAAPAMETETLQARTAIVLDVAHSVRNDAPDTEIPFPEIGGGGKGDNGVVRAGKGFFGTGREANSFVFVVDCSSSMIYEDRFQRAVDELRRVITTLKPTQKFFVIFYATESLPMYDKQPKRTAASIRKRSRRRTTPRKRTTTRKLRLVKAIDVVKQRTNSWIRRIKPMGGTRPGDSLRMALAMKPEVVYFLTDGEIPPYTDAVVREANTGNVRVNTVALGFAGSAQLLKRIAEENNGRFRFVK